MKEHPSNKVIDVVKELAENGKLEVLYSSGLLKYKTPMYYKMYLKFQAYLLQGFSRKKAVHLVADHFKYQDIRSVYMAIQVMELEVALSE